jgi:hypothetical protein
MSSFKYFSFLIQPYVPEIKKRAQRFLWEVPIGLQEVTAKTKVILGLTTTVSFLSKYLKSTACPSPFMVHYPAVSLLIPSLCFSGSTSAVLGNGWSCRGPATPAPSAGRSSPGSVFSIPFYKKPCVFFISIFKPSVYSRSDHVMNGPPASLMYPEMSP